MFSENRKWELKRRSAFSGTLKTVYLGFACTFLRLSWLDRKHIFPRFHCRFLLPNKVDHTKNLPKTDSGVI